jgi:predicted ATPase
LFYEFKVTTQSGWMVLETFSVSHGKASAYLPVIDLLHGYFEIKSEDDRRKRREKVTGRVLALDRSLEDTLPYLFGLLGLVEGEDPLARMDAQVKKRRTLDAIKRLLLRESLNQPLMVIFEDLHWIDEETQALLNLLADSIGTSRLLLLVNYRPEYSHQWGSKTYYTQLRLDPLGRESADEMLTALLAPSAPLSRSVAGEGQGEGDDLSSLKRLIIERTEGNPFFMEETVQVLLDEGALVRNGTIKLTKPLGELKIPPTVQAILAARIDRLPAEEKDLLQTLAVIGKEFPLSLVRAVVGVSADELGRVLDDLQLGEFIYEQPAVGDIEYTFKHALTQEVAYNSVLIERRKLLHERAGAATEELYGGRLDDHLTALAHHFSQSHNTTKAIHYLRLAGAQAVRRSANREAVVHLKGALDRMNSIPDSPQRSRDELDLLVMLGPVMMTLAGYASLESEMVYLRARNLCVQLGDNTRLFPVLWGLWICRVSRAELDQARHLAGELASLAEGLGDEALKLEAHHAMWNTLWLRGELTAARLHTERGAALYDPHQHGSLAALYGGHDPGVCGRSQAAVVEWLLGNPERALESSRDALTLAHELAHGESLAWALSMAAIVDQLRGDRAGAGVHAEALIALSAEHGFAQWVAVGTILRAWAGSEAANSEIKLANMRQGIAAWRAAGARRWNPYFLALTVETCCALRRVDEAREVVAEALDSVDRTGERWYEAELHRLRGELSLMGGESAQSDAEEHFRRAIEVSRQIEAKSHELRATTGLARLLAKQGKRDEARTMLAEIYGWFTEGLETADLKDAKALLDQLRD